MLLARGGLEQECIARVAGENAVPASLAAEWAALAKDAAEPNAFGEPWFVGPALDHLRGDRTIRIVEVRENCGRLLGVMPLSINPRYGRSPIAHVANWTHFQCFMGTPLVRAGAETRFWQALLALLDGSDWARGFLSISGLAEDGRLLAALASCGRPCPIVHRAERAMLASDLDADAYLAAHVRAKKRKELRRLENRLGEMGAVAFEKLSDHDALAAWCEDFLTLEASGWKGERGSAFARDAGAASFFREVMAGAMASRRLDFQRLTLDGRGIAMLTNFRTPPGSWSFKIAYDEEFARFSPGVMIELENLKRVLADPQVAWMDSCAVEGHPMIDRLWAERRSIVQVTVPLKGALRRLAFGIARTAERASAAVRKALA